MKHKHKQQSRIGLTAQSAGNSNKRLVN